MTEGPGMNGTGAAELKVLLVEDACSAVTPYLQESSLVTFAAMFGRVETTEATLAEMAAKTASSR